MTRSSHSPRTLGLAALLIACFTITAAACNRGADGRSATTADAKSDAKSEAKPAASAATAGPGSWSGDTLLGRADAARIQGSPNAKLWMVEISDFQCPYCKQWHDATYATIKRDYIDTGKIRFAYVNLPLPMHRHAQQAAQVAMCAGLQGKFWAMHDSLFASQERWEKLDNAAAAAVFDSLSAKAGADAGKVRQCVNAGTVKPLVQADYDRSVQSGVQSTPTFLIGSTMISGAQPTANFTTALDSALAATK